MRITFNMTSQTSLRNIERNTQRMSDLEANLTSGSKLSKPSDDPIGVARALGFQHSIDQSTQYLKNIDQGSSWLNNTDAALGSVTADIQRARELAVQAANGTLSPEDQKAIQLEVTQLQESVLDLSNTKIGSSYQFSGTASDKPGYSQYVSSAVNPAVYQGNTAPVLREVTPGVTMSVNANPQATFDPVFKALATLQSGLVPQASAPAVSTTATISGSVVLPVAQPAAGSLMINGVMVNYALGDSPATVAANITTAVPPTGVTASINGGGALILTSNTLGSSGTIAVGSAGSPLTLGLSANSFTIGQDDALTIQAKMQQSLTDLDLALDAIDVSRSGVGAKMNRLTTLQGQQQAVNLNLTGLLSQVKDVDMAQAITAFTMAQNVYTASLKSTAQAAQNSLLDYLH